MNRRTGASFTAGAVGGLAVATLVLPQLANTVRPTALGTLLVTLFLAFLGASVQRLNSCYSERRALESALRVWPPQTLRTTDMSALGVYPATGDRAEPYEARAEDADLDKAFQSPDPVLVHGPARAGMSRAATEAARRAFGDVPAIVPVDAAGLRWLADNDYNAKLPAPTICLWLDGLERFIETLDPPTVDSLKAASRPDVKVVATIRTKEWNEFLAANGQDAEAARALSESLEVIQLGPRRRPTHSATPAQDAATEPGPQSTEASEQRVIEPRSPLHDRWLIGLLGGLGAVIFATGFLYFYHQDKRQLLEPPPIADQMNEAVNAMLSHGGHVAVNERIRLHATEDDSWIVVVEDTPSSSTFYNGAVGNPGARPPISDELRIYDVRSGWLTLMLDFRPAGIGKTAREWVAPAGAPPALDYNSDGSYEVIAGWAIPDAHSEVLPFAINWERGQYQLISMTPDPPDLSTQGFKQEAIKDRVALYLKPATLANSIPGSNAGPLIGYQVQSFAVVEKPNVRVLTGYYADVPGSQTVLELRANQIRHDTLHLAPCLPGNIFCPAPGAEQDVIVPPDKTLDNAMLTAWKRIGTRWESAVHTRTKRGPECPAPQAPTGAHAPAGC